MRPALHIKPSQQLALAPQLQQSLHWLQCSAWELQAELQSLLQANPLLEWIQESSSLPERDTQKNDFEEGLQPQYFNVHSSSVLPFSGDEYIESSQLTQGQSLFSYLKEQLILQKGGSEEYLLLEYLMTCLNEQGYLEVTLQDICNTLSNEGVTLAQLETALAKLQQLDPPGVAARTLSECLYLQLQRIPHINSPSVFKCAEIICLQGLDMLARADIQALHELTHEPLEIIREASQIIRQLNPRPGLAWSQEPISYISVDVIVCRQESGWKVELTQEASPQLTITQYEQFQGRSQKQHLSADMQTYLAQAKAVIESLAFRGATLLKVAKAVMLAQQRFLQSGPEFIEPLTLRDIARELSLHESTISRAVNGKYIQTPYGIYELKAFFSSGVSTGDDGALSASAIQLKLKAIIHQECSSKPLSDQKIAEYLSKEGVQIARRTVAKYRDALGIPSASERKARANLHG